MKKLLTILILLVFFTATTAQAALTYGQSNYTKNKGAALSGGTNDPLYNFIGEVDGLLSGTSGASALYFTPTDTAPTASEGVLYYNDTGNGLRLYTGSAWVNVDTAGGVSLDSAYDLGSKIDVDGTVLELEVDDGSNNVALLIDHDEATNDNDAMQITNAADAAGAVSIQIDGTAGYDIQGTGDTWNISIAGAATLVGIDTTGDITLENDEVIKNDNNGEIEFGNGTEDTAFAWGTNELQVSSDTAVVTVNWGDVDAFTGVESITGDAADMTIQMTADAGGEDLLIQQAGAVDASLDLRSAGTGVDAVKVYASAGGFDIDGTNAASTITNTANGAADDLTISVAGTQNSSLILSSAGTGTDAVSILTSHANGDIKINAGDMLDIDAADDISIDCAGAAGEDILVTNTGGSITLSATEAAADSIVLSAATAAGGIDITSNADIDITTTGEAGEDISITNTGGSIIVTATENIQNGVHIEANGGTSESINLYANQGTGASATTEHDASIQLQSDAGGIGIYTTGNVADAFRLETNGGTSETITINNLQGTGAGAITIAANAAGGDLNLDSVLGRIEIEAEENVANALYLIADGGTTTTLEIFNDTGTSVTEDAAAIQLLADVGGICIQSDADLDDALVLRVDGGTTSEITIHNDQGTAADSIELLSDGGGIDITAEDLATGDIVIDANDKLTLLSTSLATAGIYLHANGGTSEGILIRSDQGTSVTEDTASIQLLSDAGGICIQSDGNLDDAVVLRADGGTAAEMTIHNDQGNTVDSIELLSDAGGILITAVKPLKLEAALTLNDQQAIAESDATPDVSGYSFFKTHTTADTIDDFDGTNIEEGQIIVVISEGAITYDVDGGALICGTTDLVTADGDVTMWIYDGTNWQLISWMDDAVDQNARG
jgi:hypothetical protein